MDGRKWLGPISPILIFAKILEQHTYNQILRNTLGITEVPLFEEEFEKWMKSRWHSSGSVQSYISWIRTLDRQIFQSGKDLMLAIALAFEKSAYNSFIIDKARSLGTVDSIEPAKEETTDNDDLACVEKSSPKYQRGETLPKEKEFYHFMKEKKGLGIGTRKSYISYIKSCDNRFVCTVWATNFNQLVLDTNYSQKVVEWILKILDNKKCSLEAKGIPSATINNWISALKAYQEFLIFQANP